MSIQKPVIKEQIVNVDGKTSQVEDILSEVEKDVSVVSNQEISKDLSAPTALEKKGSGQEFTSLTTVGGVAASAQVEAKSELRQAIERVMEADLNELYLTMSPEERLVFKNKGEATAKEVAEQVQKPKINLSKILQLLFAWLRFIPRVNNYYLQQEAKLKADQIIKLAKK
jgi:hypothetical protein